MTSTQLEQFVRELDAATQAHLGWTHRVLRCAVLQTPPGEDVLDEGAHTQCRFGHWLTDNRASFTALDGARTQDLEADHQRMHDAIRNLCRMILGGGAGQRADLDAFEASQLRLIDHLAHFKTLAVSQGSQLDPLTGLPLRHRMEQDFELLAKHSRSRGTALVVMMIDVDHFKLINDRYGHAVGDGVLHRLGAALKATLRTEDLIYRFGGEEFVALLELPTDDASVQGAAQRVLEAARAMEIPLSAGGDIRISVTVGVAVSREREGLAEVFKRADAAMYEGKAAGRDCSVIASSA